PSPTSQQILQDTGYYRVLNLTADVFNDALTSYFHNSIGGYNPAKLAIYQDLITYQLSNKLNINVLDMLNTKYVINKDEKGQPVVQQNPGNLGACWFVKDIYFVKDDAAAMRALDNNNPADSAIVETADKNKITFMPAVDSNAIIHLIKNDNDIITYSSQSKSNQFAVFSEIYYDRGWKAYIDNKEAPIIRTDYVLRGLAVPAGNHNIRFEFKPASFYNSEIIAIIASAVIWLLLAFTAFLIIRRRRSIQHN
ncbi:MAG: YfhO family protein, partial [Parafilimonas sp.]